MLVYPCRNVLLCYTNCIKSARAVYGNAQRACSKSLSVTKESLYMRGEHHGK